MWDGRRPRPQGACQPLSRQPRPPRRWLYEQNQGEWYSTCWDAVISDSGEVERAGERMHGHGGATSSMCRPPPARTESCKMHMPACMPVGPTRRTNTQKGSCVFVRTQLHLPACPMTAGDAFKAPPPTLSSPNPRTVGSEGLGATAGWKAAPLQQARRAAAWRCWRSSEPFPSEPFSLLPPQAQQPAQHKLSTLPSMCSALLTISST